MNREQVLEILIRSKPLLQAQFGVRKLSMKRTDKELKNRDAKRDLEIRFTRFCARNDGCQSIWGVEHGA